MSDELTPVEEQIASFKRAIEAVIIVSHDPVPPSPEPPFPARFERDDPSAPATVRPV